MISSQRFVKIFKNIVVKQKYGGGGRGQILILGGYMFITSPYDILFNVETSFAKKETNCDRHMNGRTDGVNLSLLELLIAAKNKIHLIGRPMDRAL